MLVFLHSCFRRNEGEELAPYIFQTAPNTDNSAVTDCNDGFLRSTVSEPVTVGEGKSGKNARIRPEINFFIKNWAAVVFCVPEQEFTVHRCSIRKWKLGFSLCRRKGTTGTEKSPG